MLDIRQIQKGNLLHIVGKLVEANKQYSSDDYELRFNSIRQLNILVNPNNKIHVDIGKHPIDKASELIKKISNEEREQFLPIEKVILNSYEKREINITLDIIDSKELKTLINKVSNYSIPF